MSFLCANPGFIGKAGLIVFTWKFSQEFLIFHQSSAVLSQQSVVRDHFSHSGSSVKTGGIPRVEWGMYKTALVVVLQKMM